MDKYRNVCSKRQSNYQHMKIIWFKLVIFVFALAPYLAKAGGDEVIVIYNMRLPESKEVAEYYAQRRHVPTNQVFGFDLPTGADISRTEYHDALEKPLAKRLEARDLWKIRSQTVPETSGVPMHIVWKVTQSKIRYAVLCYGVPYRIPEDPQLKEEQAEKMRPELRRNGAAVDSELACLPLIEEDYLRAGPLQNPLYGATNENWFAPTNNVLMVTRLDGPSATIARGLVDKAMDAETNGLWGRAYFDLRGITEPGYKMGDEWIGGAAEICRRLGFETTVDTNGGTFPAGFPMSQIAFYCGWYAGDACGPFAQPTVEFMPGAFAYHLHSFSAANLRSRTQNWVGPLLAKGATVTMGCVAEPYLAGTPNVSVFAARFIYDGFTFGEAAYASQPVLSWQTTVVGDPLYRPFGIPAEKLQQELDQRHSKLLAWYYLRAVNMNQARGVALGELEIFLENLNLTRHSAVLTEKLGDILEALGKPSSAVNEYQRALALNPSPEQKVRLMLTLGEKLIAQNRPEDAYEDYQQFLKNFPNYADILSINRKLLALAKQLGKTDDAAKYEAEIQRLTPPPPPPENVKTNQ